MKKIILYFIFFCLNTFANNALSEIKILYKINDSVITSHDVVEEINYLVSLRVFKIVFIFNSTYSTTLCGY